MANVTIVGTGLRVVRIDALAVQTLAAARRDGAGLARQDLASGRERGGGEVRGQRWQPRENAAAGLLAIAPAIAHHVRETVGHDLG